jgi:hypothetical protein
VTRGAPTCPHLAMCMLPHGVVITACGMQHKGLFSSQCPPLAAAAAAAVLAAAGDGDGAGCVYVCVGMGGLCVSCAPNQVQHVHSMLAGYACRAPGPCGSARSRACAVVSNPGCSRPGQLCQSVPMSHHRLIRINHLSLPGQVQGLAWVVCLAVEEVSWPGSVVTPGDVTAGAGADALQRQLGCLVRCAPAGAPTALVCGRRPSGL